MVADMNYMKHLEILSDKKVLCADDEQGVLKNMVEILETFFEKVTAVSDGEEALSEAKNNLYDVLIFDISMPNMDGLEAIKEIRKENKKIPIIILSAHTDQEYLWRAVDLKITKYLTKPCNQNELFKALEIASLELVDYNEVFEMSTTCTYNYCTKQLTKESEVIKLSKSESRLLEYFIKNTNQVITYENILDYMWDFEKPSKEAVKSIVKDLRRKICSDFIKNIYGVGYMCEI